MNLLTHIRQRPWATFLFVQALGCAAVAIGSVWNLFINVLGLILLLPGSASSAYALALLGTREFHGMLLSDAFYLPAVVSINTILFAVTKYLLQLRRRRRNVAPNKLKEVGTSEA
jgi:hypothetical protein